MTTREHQAEKLAVAANESVARLPWVRKRKTPAELVDEAIAQLGASE